jgi:hypothetical protein
MERCVVGGNQGVRGVRRKQMDALKVSPSILAGVARVASTDPTRPAIGGVLVESDGAAYAATATDGHCLVRVEVGRDGDTEWKRLATLSSPGIATLAKAMKTQPKKMGPDVQGKANIVTTPRPEGSATVEIPAVGRVDVKTVEKPFPPYPNVMPDTSRGHVVIHVNPAILRDTLDAMLRACPGLTSVKLCVPEDNLSPVAITGHDPALDADVTGVVMPRVR